MQKVYLVGAGPGDKELITVKGLRLLKECDVVIYDRLVSLQLLEEVRADCRKVCVGKEPGRHSMSQEEINGLLVEYGKKYDKVVRLKGGDPFVFGRGGEEAEALQKAGLSFELVPGVTSAVAVPECAGIPVTHRGMSQSFHVITGHTKDGEHALTENYHILAGLDGTLVFLMGLGNLKEITERLISNGKDKATPAAVIEKGTTSEERIVKGTLETIYSKVIRAGLSSPVVILIGETAALSYGKNMECQNKMVGITATRGTADKLRSALEQEGFHVVETCKMEVEEIREAGQQDQLKAALSRLEEYQWILFTSPNGVRIFMERAQAEGIEIPVGTGLKFAVIGSGSRAALKEYGIEADFIPKTYTSRDFALEFVKQAGSGEKILVPRARQGSRELTRILKEHGYDYEEISLYDVKGSLCVKPETLEKIDCHVFVSASGVKSFFGQIQELAPDYQFQGNIACIGQVTKEEVERQGFSPRILAQVSDVEGLVESIRIYFEKTFER